MQFIFLTHTTRTRRVEDIKDSFLPISILNHLQRVRGSFEMGKSAKLHKRTVRPMTRKFRRSLTCSHHTRPEKDNRQPRRFHIRSAAIAVQATTQVRASAAAANGRGVRGEKIEATKRDDTRKEQGRDRRGEFGCEWSRWCVVVWACARRCGLRGYCDGQSTARARGGAKAAPSRVVASADAAVLLY